tara:strand:+ start:1603 stop:2148 length:546 start_codon:yes stop_codon:yes gene_type:complete
MKPFNEAWSMLKALPEQQSFTQRIRRPVSYGGEPAITQNRKGTIHPAILGMMERMQNRARRAAYESKPPQYRDKVFRPKTRTEVVPDYKEKFTLMGRLMSPVPLSETEEMANQQRRLQQSRRGSVYDQGMDQDGLDFIMESNAGLNPYAAAAQLGQYNPMTGEDITRQTLMDMSRMRRGGN